MSDRNPAGARVLLISPTLTLPLVSVSALFSPDVDVDLDSPASVNDLSSSVFFLQPESAASPSKIIPQTQLLDPPLGRPPLPAEKSSLYSTASPESPRIIRGELSESYLYDKAMPSRIKLINPNAKVKIKHARPLAQSSLPKA